MSLINKMLQDLDARGGAPAGAPGQATIKPVLHDERRPQLLLAGGVVLLAVLGVAGYFGWRALKAPPPLAVVAPTPITVPVKTVLLTPSTAPPVPEVEPAQLAEPEPEVIAAPPPRKVKAEPREEKPRVVQEKKVESAKPAKTAVLAASPRQQTAQQGAETEYRRALGILQEGRTSDAIAALDHALLIDPRHEAARQTMIGLLIENRRPDDAIRQLRLGLGAEPRQPAMAMLLARLQIERGGSGIDTLQRTLPFAVGNAEYHAFLAGALQREQRHREAAELYQAALRVGPQNGVWLMGLGISLVAEKRTAEALDAFQKARSSSSLSPELQAFVDRKLQQLAR